MHIQSINFLTSNSIEERKFPEQLDIHMEKKKKKNPKLEFHSHHSYMYLILKKEL